MSFGAEVRRRRRWLDLTQAELGKKIGCHAMRISAIEHDRSAGIEARTVIGLERALDMPPGSLLMAIYADMGEKGGEQRQVV